MIALAYGAAYSSWCGFLAFMAALFLAPAIYLAVKHIGLAFKQWRRK